MPLTVREISATEMVAFQRGQAEVPLEQLPQWAATSRWLSLHLGWFEDNVLVGTALVLGRRLPRTPWWLAYVPEGPVLDWSVPDAAALRPLVDELGRRGAFMVKIGPRLAVRRWHASTVREALTRSPVPARWRDMAADETTPFLSWRDALAEDGWLPFEARGPGFGGTLQPRYGFELRLAGQDPDGLLSQMSTQWRRNVRRAESRGLQVADEGTAGLDDFMGLLDESATRRGFRHPDRAWFDDFISALSRPPARSSLYVARHGGVAHAAMLAITHPGRVSYTHGGSDTAGRGLRPSNAVLWRMATDALATGAPVLDLRGAADGLSEGSPEQGLTPFKAGMGADAVEYLGEWDYPIVRPLALAFRTWWNRRPH